MKLIPLSQGKFAQVDDADYDYLMQWEWHFKKGYAFRNQCSRVRGKKITKFLFMHRVIDQTPGGIENDHLDGDGLNNTRGNIRRCSRSQNCQNRKKFKNMTSKYKGVSWHNQHKKWAANINISGKRIFLGLFIHEQIAAVSYDLAAKIYHAEFALLNFGHNRG